jgi:uncharacterized membrane protein
VLIAGYVLKSCPGWFDRELPAACHTDITALYTARGIDRHVVPYIDGRLEGHREAGELTGYDLRLEDGANEYPVLTGLFMWATGFLAEDTGRYLQVSAALLGAAAVATAWLLGGLVGRRALLWAASPALGLFAFHNWDVLAVAAAMAGIWAWARRRAVTSAVWFGLGGALKSYPLLFLVPLALERWRVAGRRGAVVSAGVGALAFVMVNLPVLIASPEGWAITYRFHTLRPPNYDSLWGVGDLYDLGPGVINALSTALLVGSSLVVLWVAARRADRDGRYPFVQACAALLAVSLLWGKVHSPQYALWILLFFALLDVRLRWWLAYMIDVVVLYVAIFGLGTFSVRALEIATSAGVYFRAALLLALIPIFLRSDTSFDVVQPLRRASGEPPVRDRGGVDGPGPATS